MNDESKTPDTIEPILVGPDPDTDALYEAALAESTSTESEAAQALLKAQILEVRRLQDLLEAANARLERMRSMSPRELARMAGADGGAFGWPNRKELPRQVRALMPEPREYRL